MTTDTKYLPALRFDALTPLFDGVAAVTVRDGELKRRVLEHAALAPGEKVLDVGCGTGTLALAASEAADGLEVAGLDADPRILEIARAKMREAGAEVKFDEGMSSELPYADGSFDVVLSTLFFHHLPDSEKHRTAREIMRVLRPGGRLIVGDMGRPHGPLMRFAVRVTVQVFDGTATTSLNIRGGLPAVLEQAGLQGVAVRDRMRTPVGTCEVFTATRAEAAGRSG